MIRRRVALLCAATVPLAACGTLTDNDLAARVDDAVLDQSEFDLLANTAAGQPDADRVDVPFSTVQNVLNTWIVNRIVIGELEAAGETPEPAPPADDALSALLNEQEVVFTQWQELPGATDEEFRAAYQRGPEYSEVACTSHVLVPTRAEADEVVAQLDDGADFAEVARERSTDTVSAEVGGSLGCMNVGEFRQQFIPEFVDAALDAEIGQPTGPVESQIGYHVILVRPFDEIQDVPEARTVFESDGVRFRRAARAADIRIDPRFGAFDPEFCVVPLG
ncbi:peptidylprolyl isomerase [soil metagenome]